jgi:hypothetical protein
MIIDMTINLESLAIAKQEVITLMGNPYCDHLMFMNLRHKLDGIEANIKELEDGDKTKGE